MHDWTLHRAIFLPSSLGCRAWSLSVSTVPLQFLCFGRPWRFLIVHLVALGTASRVGLFHLYASRISYYGHACSTGNFRPCVRIRYLFSSDLDLDLHQFVADCPISFSYFTALVWVWPFHWMPR
ncbi:hypothetical protein PLICRDRAFT_333321 [Plicaturopsis crispa FD-325 SS-3]|uniref:Uncharacterized protein n=1 Tax=Plicaturopsis crispa FD-325 SS-3 TaxID=944288 RepID=A0A0C9TA26_PLICR|nr:hypothetical protein PLICRDRAFT_333321 [Plicaturopsis crispa FD-325 SS-3]